MFKNTYQSGFISILYAGGSKPLSLWGQVVRNGHIRRVTDEDVQTLAVEIMGTNVATTYIICPSDKKSILGIRLPFFVMIVKNMKKYFTFEIQILDDKNMSRRFRVSNYQSTTRVRPFSTSLPIGLTGGWNQIQFNLADFTRRAYGSSYIETLRIQIHANVRIRRIYFSDRLYGEDEMPAEFKLYVPVTTKREKPTVGKPPPREFKVEDKSTGADIHRHSKIETIPEETMGAGEIPAGALPSPTEGSVREATDISEMDQQEEGQMEGGFEGDEEYFGEEEEGMDEPAFDQNTFDDEADEAAAGEEEGVTEEAIAHEEAPAEEESAGGGG